MPACSCSSSLLQMDLRMGLSCPVIMLLEMCWGTGKSSALLLGIWHLANTSLLVSPTRILLSRCDSCFAL